MKNLSVILVILYTSFSVLSCREKGVETGSELLNNSFSLVRLDSQGKNILDPSTANYISGSAIRTSYVIDGKKVEVDDANMAARYGVVLQSTDNNPSNNYLRVEVYTGRQDQETTTTYIQWPNNEVDTVKTLMTIKPGLSFISKLWLNNELKYEAGKTNGSNWGGFPMERLVIIRR